MPVRIVFLAACLTTGLASAASAAPMLADTFDTENGGVPVLNYTDFKNFTVTAGSVDLIGNGYFDQYAGNGLYLDSAGSTNQPGTLTSKDTFGPGAYQLSLQLAGPIYTGSTSMLLVTLGSFSETFNLTAGIIENFTRTFTLSAAAALTIADAGTSMNNPNIGSTIFAVNLSNIPLAVGAVPEPATLALLGAGLLGLGLVRRRRAG